MVNPKCKMCGKVVQLRSFDTSPPRYVAEHMCEVKLETRGSFDEAANEFEVAQAHGPLKVDEAELKRQIEHLKQLGSGFFVEANMFGPYYRWDAGDFDRSPVLSMSNTQHKKLRRALGRGLESIGRHHKEQVERPDSDPRSLASLRNSITMLASLGGLR